ncbi:MAG: hypothetical protein K2U26_06275 [Cyclobacteriaceae bacterium]|nr:hypothetical protein [Cyclobacteriaceae bacterium]
MKTSLNVFFLLLFVAGTTFAQRHGRHDRKDSYGYQSGYRGQGSLSEKIIRVTQVDSAQAKKIRPVIERSERRVRALRADFQKKEKQAMDSLQLALKPMLKEDQRKRLTEFSERKHRTN